MPLLNDAVKVERGSRKPIGLEFVNDDDTPRDVSALTAVLAVYSAMGTALFSITGTIGDTDSQVFFMPNPTDFNIEVGQYYADVTLGVDEKWHLTVLVEGKYSVESAGERLTTLKRVKDFLGIAAGETQSDPDLDDLILAVSNWFCSQIGRKILKATYTDTFSTVNDNEVAWRNYGLSISPRQYPIISVTEVRVDDTVIPARSSIYDSQATYVIANGKVLILNFVPWLLGTVPGLFGSPGIQNVSVQYDAGYDTVPSEVEDAIIELVAWRWKARDHLGQRSKSIGGEVVSYDTSSAPTNVQDIIDTYRVLNV